jgi:ethanolamine utilization protein EutN
MKLGRVVGHVISTHTFPIYEGRKLMLVQALDSTGANASGAPFMAIDYVGAGEGDLVIYSAAPGLASDVFASANAPVNDLIMGIIDRVDHR